MQKKSPPCKRGALGSASAQNRALIGGGHHFGVAGQIARFDLGLGAGPLGSADSQFLVGDGQEHCDENETYFTGMVRGILPAAGSLW